MHTNCSFSLVLPNLVSIVSEEESTIAEKLHIIDRIKKGETQASIIRRELTKRGWIKDEDKLRNSSSSLEDCGQARKRARLAEDQQLEEAMMTWFSQARSEGMPISGPVIQTQAKKFHRDIHGQDETFFASSGWLNRFKQRHGIKQVSIRREQRSADEEPHCSTLFLAFYHNILL